MRSDRVSPRMPGEAEGSAAGKGMAESVFLDTFVNKVDAKGRVSVPASFRAAVQGQSFHGIVLFPSFKAPALEGSGIDRIEKLAASLDNYDVFSDEQDDLAATIFSQAKQLGFDGDGRVILPAELAAHAGIDGRCAFVGRGPTFQIWNPDTFEAWRAEAAERARSRGMTVPMRSPDAPRDDGR